MIHLKNADISRQKVKKYGCGKEEINDEH